MAEVDSQRRRALFREVLLGVVWVLAAVAVTVGAAAAYAPAGWIVGGLLGAAVAYVLIAGDT